MKVTCYDTSFLFSIYGKGRIYAACLERLSTRSRPVFVTAISNFEMENAFYLAEFRKLYARGTTIRTLAAMQLDFETGKLKFQNINLAVVFREAKRLSSLHTVAGGFRSHDILHVASAICCGASEFVTFDKNQKNSLKLRF